MGVLNRLVDLTKATAHEVLGKLENPVIMMNQYLRDMKGDIDELKQSLLQQQATERAMEQRIVELSRLAEHSELKAMEALQGGQEAEARLALEAKMNYSEKITEYTARREDAKVQSVMLAEQLEAAETEYAKLQEKRTELAARLQKAEAQTAVSSFSRGLEGGTAARGFERIEEKIMQLEAQHELSKYASAHAGIAPIPAAGSGEQTEAAAKREAYIEEQLARLRNKLPQAE
ncbi:MULTISPECIES: PspA/IM30 family protein [unclassified Paenibacillus]|uniref:PspA/IM30 family protein n=1 Tax=unclassified Paenibacillus TaxID=185978 RepID=UPI001C1223EB|nr:MULTISPECIES: PspA/IM30 family protein [unclassified Paenibacillus]MBU5441346.1 PspA/IM30 family protein [Paenibacillus sp. MSJ-34]CAH0120914.1 Protein LiaH [Paenibacillus sp. CECT 9249]